MADNIPVVYLTPQTYLLTELCSAEREAGAGMGSWLSSFMKCGRTNCGGTQQNSQVRGLVSANVVAYLQTQNKRVTDVAKLNTATEQVLQQWDAYNTVQTDPNVVNGVILQIVSILQTQGALETITPVSPTTPTTPGITQPIAVGGMSSQDLLIYGGLGLGAFAVLMMAMK